MFFVQVTSHSKTPLWLFAPKVYSIQLTYASNRALAFSPNLITVVKCRVGYLLWLFSSPPVHKNAIRTVYKNSNNRKPAPTKPLPDIYSVFSPTPARSAFILRRVPLTVSVSVIFSFLFQIQEISFSPRCPNFPNISSSSLTSRLWNFVSCLLSEILYSSLLPQMLRPICAAPQVHQHS